jgi:hypothetical protein
LRELQVVESARLVAVQPFRNLLVAAQTEVVVPGRHCGDDEGPCLVTVVIEAVDADEAVLSWVTIRLKKDERDGCGQNAKRN